MTHGLPNKPLPADGLESLRARLGGAFRAAAGKFIMLACSAAAKEPISVNSRANWCLTHHDYPDEFTGPINIGNPVEFAILEPAELVLKLTRSNSKFVFKPLPS
ncbi:MAG: hypothetical protein WBE48_01560, partial [Xanthobacteraceae bacterium]